MAPAVGLARDSCCTIARSAALAPARRTRARRRPAARGGSRRVVSCSPISTSGFVPASRRRNSLSDQPIAEDDRVLLCSAASRCDVERRRRRAARRTPASAAARTHAAPSCGRPARARAPRAAHARTRRRAPASTITPLRAPVTRASTACGVLGEPRRRRRRRQIASGRKYRSRPPSSYSTSTIVRKSGCGPRRSSAPVEEPRRAQRARLAAEPSLALQERQPATRARSACGRCRRAACPTPTPMKNAGSVSHRRGGLGGRAAR